MKVAIPVFTVVVASVLLLYSGKLLPSVNINVHANTFINGIIKYQIYAIFIAVAVMLITLFITPESKPLLQLGHLDSIAIKEKWLGINGKTSWRKNGLQLAFFISIATGIFMFLAVKYTNSLYNFKWSFVPIILLVSLTNSFSEEIIYRFAINGNLMHLTSKLTILICSAVLFGLPHYQGYPNGFMGVLMAGLLGYILSKATYETQGLGLAWIIHFLQDIIIFTSLFMINIKT